MRVWRSMALVCSLAIGCGGPLPEDQPEQVLAGEHEEVKDELSSQWKKRKKHWPGRAELVRDIFPEPGSEPTQLVDAQGTLFFAANYETGEAELWRSDGTRPGTFPVMHFPPVSFGDNAVRDLTAVKDRVFFTAESEQHGRALWVSDGTPWGTRLLMEITSGVDSAMLFKFTAVGDTLFFFRSVLMGPEPGITRFELWTSDGTAAGTKRVQEFGSEVVGVGETLALDDDTLLFVARDLGRGAEPWRSDGTEEGTRLIKNIRFGFPGSEPRDFVVKEGIAFFSAEDREHGRELWKTDGTEEGTVLVEDVVPGPEGSEARPLDFLRCNLYFTTTEAPEGGLRLRKLKVKTKAKAWRHHRRSVPVADIPNPYADETDISASVATVTATRKKLYFTVVFDTGNGLEPEVPRDVQLWRTTGSRKGTKLLYQPLVTELGLEVPTPQPLDDGRSVLFFAYDEEHGHEPWVSYGTPWSTRLLQDINPSRASSNPQQLTRSGDFIFFVANDGVTGRELWALPLSGRGRYCPAPYSSR